MVVLIGNHPRNLIRYAQPEIEYAIEKNLPIIAINLNTRRKQDDLCPQVLKDELVLYVAFGRQIVEVALNNWPDSYALYKMEGKAGPYHYFDSVYAGLKYQLVG